MKKIYSLSTLALLAVVLLSACSRDSDEEDIVPGIIVDEVKCDPMITDFFNKKVYTESLYPITAGFRPPFYDETTGEIRYIVIINNEEELLNIFPDAGELPKIDFSKYSVLIGCTPFGSGLEDKIPRDLKRKVMYMNNNQYTLALYFSYTFSEIGWDMQQYVLTWGIYPKLSSDSISIILKFV